MSLETLLHEIPTTSGVYEFFDSSQRLLYVGKAKNLKKRVHSYFRQNPLAPAPNLSPRIHKMISETESLHYLLTSTEHDALLLENSLIKQLKPKYNILLRDDKTYPYIYYNDKDAFPRLEITRKILKAKGVRYFGPYTKGASDLLKSIYELLPLAQSKSCLRGKKACLFAQLQKCSAPCEGRIETLAYRKHLEQALAWLQNPALLLPQLQAKMFAYSEQERFEEACELRDRIRVLQSLEIHSQIDLAKLHDIDILNIAKDGNQALLVWLFMRNGRIVSSAQESLRGEFEQEELFVRAILNRYSAPLPLAPKSILVPIELQDKEILQNHIHEHCGRIALTTARAGYQKELLALCAANALENLRLLVSRDDDSVLEGLCAFGLSSMPLRVECFDVSHFQKQAAVGSMIVSNRTEFDKESYRRYELHHFDEYANMREMLSRRAQSFATEPPPDLWLLDGGKAQVAIALEILQSFCAHVEVLGIAKEKLDSKAHRAKGASFDVIYTQSEDFRLAPSDKRLQFLQKLRDEAHRFAISYHRNKKRKQDLQLDVLRVHGLGKAKLKRLLDFFGSFEALSRASLEELGQVLDARSARQTYEALQQREDEG